ncbi:MAG: thioredoxin domain-containing protein, partial [Thermoplasmatota archaeon]
MNRLAKESSSYLRSAAHQPTHWFPWGDEAFAKAKREAKPVLLDIGAVWCHWCHVMDHESYESPELAKLLNEKFVCVKLDRDERPDVDARYQRAVSSLTGQGGWPLTAFLTAERDVFYGGTYFPPTDSYGRPSFTKVLEAVADAFANRRDEVEKTAAGIREHLAGHAEGHADDQVVHDVSPGALDASIIDDGLEALQAGFDATNGGWGAAPKFPHPGAFEFLLAAIARQRARGNASAALEDIARTTPAKMGAGGVYDHVGGGFHRYATDATWTVPHFEKMLYDNAELLRNYAHAAALFDDPALLAKARDVWRFMRDVLGDADRGGFGGSQDADVDLTDDGDFFTWTLEEVNAAIPEATNARIVALRYNVEVHGEMHHDTARNVLFEDVEPEAIADALKLPLAE